MFIWRKKKSTKSRTSALFGRWGYKHWDFLCRKHISRGSEICLWLIWASMQNSRLATWRWTRYCSFAKQAGWKKKRLSWSLLSVCEGTIETKVRNRDRKRFHYFFLFVFHPLLWPWSQCQAPEGPAIVPWTWGPVLADRWQHVADRLSPLFWFTTVHSPASVSIINASKNSGTVQQTKTQPQLTEWTAGPQPGRSLIQSL